MIDLRISLLPKLLRQYITVFLIELGYNTLLWVKATVLLLFNDLFLEFFLGWIVCVPQASMAEDVFGIDFIYKESFRQSMELVIKEEVSKLM